MKVQLSTYIKTIESIIEEITPLRSQGKTIVTTNGCFDLLHRGHIHYLADAAQQGDILIVGINSDSSVTHLKGPSRPIQNADDRAYILAALEMVDYTFIFSEPDPCAFLERIRPDVHVKGGDYTAATIPETAVVQRNGGKIAIVPFIKGYSTTSLFNRLS